MCTIFGSLLKSAYPNEDSDVLQRLVAMAIQVHRRVGTMFLVTPDRLHYLFSLQHVASVFRCVLVSYYTYVYLAITNNFNTFYAAFLVIRIDDV